MILIFQTRIYMFLIIKQYESQYEILMGLIHIWIKCYIQD